MGAQLVSQALTNWTHVSDRAFRLLVRMALTALDRPSGDKPAKVYFGGRELLAMTLRGDGASDRTRYRAVARVLAELAAAGAVERLDAGRHGHNAAYRLTLGRDSKDGSTGHPTGDFVGGSKDGRTDHPQGGSRDHPQGGSTDHLRMAPETTPRNHRGTIEELLEERSGPSSTTSLAPRASAPDESAVVVELFPGALQEPAYVRPPGATRAQEVIAEAMARRAAAREAHRKETS